MPSPAGAAPGAPSSCAHGQAVAPALPATLQAQSDSLIARFNLGCANRHRAGRRRSGVAILGAARAELGDDAIAHAVRQLMGRQRAAAAAGRQPDRRTADTPGVLPLLGRRRRAAVYWAKASTCAAGCCAFQRRHPHQQRNAPQPASGAHRLIDTVGEFGALLVESRQIKTLQPVHNARPPRSASCAPAALPREDGFSCPG